VEYALAKVMFVPVEFSLSSFVLIAVCKALVPVVNTFVCTSPESGMPPMVTVLVPVPLLVMLPVLLEPAGRVMLPVRIADAP
jgi:hypothetical protein